MKTPVLPVIMAGGSGTRLWPLSRAGYPKQFLVLTDPAVDARSLFQQAVARLQALADDGTEVRPPLVVGNEEHRFLVLDQLREIAVEPQAVVLEPLGRNTAPALTLAALQALEDGQDPVLVVTPADQTVTQPEAFTASLRRAVAVAAGGGIAILGVVPDRPETGYGYIRAGRRGAGDEAAVERFVEKPDLATAQRYLAEGQYFWNAGMFVLKASVWMAALGALPARHRRRLPRRLGAAQDRRALRAAGQGRVRRGAVGIGRLRGDGALPRQRHRHPHGRAGRRLERPGRLGGRVAGGPEGRPGQRPRGRRHRQRQPQHAGARHQPPGERGGPGQRGGGRDARRRAGGRPRAPARR